MEASKIFFDMINEYAAPILEANVKTMHKNGADTKMISKLLGIPSEEIEEILNKQ